MKVIEIKETLKNLEQRSNCIKRKVAAFMLDDPHVSGVNYIHQKAKEGVLDSQLYDSWSDHILNNKAENIIKLIAEKFGHNKTGIEENLFNERIKELKAINKQILEEVENIKNYKIDQQ